MTYTIEVLRNKAYRPVHKGKLSQCFRRLPSLYSRTRIKNAETGEVLFTRSPVEQEA